MKRDLSRFLGRRVTVLVDRPLGTPHPRFPDGEPYPVNYGFLPGTVSGDGRPIDVYLVGWDEPLERAEAVVAAVVHRLDDLEDKLVAVPPDRVAGSRSLVDAARLEAAVRFQERYFRTRWVLARG